MPLDSLGEGYRRYRPADPPAEQAMLQSLERWGQPAPLVVCVRGEQWQVVDGFKRPAAARLLGWPTLPARRPETDDERTVKAALYGLNRVGRHLQELEEVRLVQALVREDGRLLAVRITADEVIVQDLTAALADHSPTGRLRYWTATPFSLLRSVGNAIAGQPLGGGQFPSRPR